MTSSNLPLEEVGFAIVDVETTGLGRADRIIEIACVRLMGFREVARFESLINPGMSIAPKASEVSGITDEMVAQAPIFPEVAPAFEELLCDAVLVAHNAPFDLSFISRERKRWSLPSWRGPVLDTLRLARNTLTLPSYALGSLAQSLQLANRPQHRAMSDVLTTVSLLETLIGSMKPAPTGLAQLLKAQEPVTASWAEAIAAGVARETILPLEEAEKQHRIAEVDYESNSGVHSYWIRPLGMEHNGPLFYLRAELAEGAEVRVFRTDRLLAVRLPGCEPNGIECPAPDLPARQARPAQGGANPEV